MSYGDKRKETLQISLKSLSRYPLRLFLLCLVCKDSPIFGIWFGRGRAKMSHRQTSEKAQ